MNYDELPVARQYGNVDNYNKSDLQANSVNHIIAKKKKCTWQLFQIDLQHKGWAKQLLLLYQYDFCFAWSHSHHFMQMNASTVCSAPQSNEKVTFIVIMWGKICFDGLETNFRVFCL